MNVTDGWNEYHSILLREGDSHVTIFFTPFGSFCYTTEPQGFVSSSDGYNCCFSAILSDFNRKERCVDNTVFYDLNKSVTGGLSPNNLSIKLYQIL